MNKAAALHPRLQGLHAQPGRAGVTPFAVRRPKFFCEAIDKAIQTVYNKFK